MREKVQEVMDSAHPGSRGMEKEEREDEEEHGQTVWCSRLGQMVIVVFLKKNRILWKSHFLVGDQLAFLVFQMLLPTEFVFMEDGRRGTSRILTDTKFPVIQ